MGYIPARHLPGFVEDYLRDVIAEKDNYADYYDYVVKHGAEVVKQLLEKYKPVKPYAEEPEAYHDWEDDEKFSLIKYGQAECSAGLFDIIELDQDTIAEKRKAIAAGTAKDLEKELHDIVFSENRMLLVTRGIDPRTDDDVYNGFLKEFISTGIVPQKFSVLTNRARRHEPLADQQPLIYELADLLNELYKGMDDNLQFKTVSATAQPQSAVSKQTDATPEPAVAKVSPAPATSAAAPSKPDGLTPDVKKDFRGVACPMNFVKTKIALSPMKSGQVLEILLDDGQPIQNVPGSVKNEGHTVLSTEKVDNYWKVLIKKK